MGDLVNGSPRIIGRPRSVIRRGTSRVWLAGVLAISLLVVAGVGFRVAAAKFSWTIGEPVKLPVPLSEIPMEINGWVGAKLDIPAVTDEYLRSNYADDYVSRQYVHAAAMQRAKVYVVYCSSRPAGIIGHQPRVCYPAHGWEHEQTVESEIVGDSGRAIQCEIHRFRDRDSYQQEVVLSFYVVNGRTTVREKDFASVLGRRPNLSGDYARYVAQVQISASLGLPESSERSVRAAARGLVDTILAYLPDPDGRVAAADPNEN
jgi:EpsI family protein